MAFRQAGTDRDGQNSPIPYLTLARCYAPAERGGTVPLSDNAIGIN
jgi:hypothetical protein